MLNMFVFFFSAVHHQKIIHRDIKPSNLLLSDDDHVKVNLNCIRGGKILALFKSK